MTASSTRSSGSRSNSAADRVARTTPDAVDNAPREWLVQAVGDAPTDRSWRDEWPYLRLEEYRRTGQFHGETEAWVCEHDSIERMVQGLHERVKWKLRNGWTKDDAEAITCICSGGLASLGRAVREGAGEYAASTHVLTSALCERALTAATVTEPPVYRHLSGAISLSTLDPAWEPLARAAAAKGSALSALVGVPFTTSAASLASDTSACFPASGKGCAPLRPRAWRPRRAAVRSPRLAQARTPSTHQVATRRAPALTPAATPRRWSSMAKSSTCCSLPMWSASAPPRQTRPASTPPCRSLPRCTRCRRERPSPSSESTSLASGAHVSRRFENRGAHRSRRAARLACSCAYVGPRAGSKHSSHSP